LITAAITRLTSPGTQARQGRERHALLGLVVDRLAQARYRLNFRQQLRRINVGLGAWAGIAVDANE
jgi:hypothetical protein